MASEWREADVFHDSILRESTPRSHTSRNKTKARSKLSNRCFQQIRYSYPNSFRLAAMAASSLATSLIYCRSVAVSRFIFSSNGSPSSTCASAPT